MEKIEGQIQDVAGQNSQSLEKITVLGNIARITELKRPNERTLSLVAEKAQQTTETYAPLDPEFQGYLQGSLGTYLTDYTDHINDQLQTYTPQNPPSLDHLNRAKELAHEKAAQNVATQIQKSRSKKFKSRINFTQAAGELATSLGLKPASSAEIESLGLGTGTPKALALASKAGATNFGTGAAVLLGERSGQDAYHSLLLFNQPRFQQKLQEYQEEERGYRTKKSLSYRERISYRNLKKKIGELKTARDLFYKKPKLVRTYQSYFHNLKGLTLKQASDSAWATTGAIYGESPGLFIPKAYLNPQILRGRTIANLAFKTGGFKPNAVKALLKTGTKVGSKSFVIGMAASIAAGPLKKIAKYGSIGLGSLGLYSLALGQAAFVGFLVGATVGGATGAIAGGILGAQIGATVGTFILGPGFGTVIEAVVGGAIGATAGFFAGAIVGGTAGALIGLGLATNSGTLTASGLGMATGATIGFAVGGPLGALAGAVIGWAAGYLVGKFIIPAIKSFAGGTATATTGIATGTSSIVGSVASFFTGIGATIWNGAGAIAGGTLGALGAGANFIIGGIGSLSFPANAVLVPVAGSIGAVGVGGILVGTITATSFFSTAVDKTGVVVPGENEFFSLTKTASPTRMDNSQLPSNISYTITLRAKTSLTSTTSKALP